MESIPNFFEGKNIFITGGSGFVGNVLIEKLLRSCSGLENIYLLVRDKKGKNPQERIHAITSNVLFDGLRENNPAIFKKLIAIPGDITKIGLGINENDVKLLQSKVDIIYNCAATVRFDLPLSETVLTNVRSARELCKIALNCSKLKVLVHVSTAYSNVHTSYIEEKVYPPLMPWEDLINVVENEKYNLHSNILSHKLIGDHPNTYTFSKQVAESVFTDMCSGKIPLIIHRPSIVVHCKKEPIEGWVSSFNGPFVLCAPVLKGVCNIILMKNGECTLNSVYVDNVAKTIIISSWLKCNQRPIDDNISNKDIVVYNACSEVLFKLKYFQMRGLYDRCLWEKPMENRMWMPPKSFFVRCRYYYYFCFIWSNVLPGIIADLLLKFFGKKPMIIRVLKTLYVANNSLYHFMTNEFDFDTKNYRFLENNLLECDREDFSYLTNLEDFDLVHFFNTALLSMKTFLFGEKVPIGEKTIRNTYRWYYIDLAYKCLKYCLILFVLYKVFF